MYIAIIADNIADRKQLERLMTRTGDSVKDVIGNLYIESYGNVAAALTAPMKYSLFILDFTQTPSDAVSLIQGLHNTNATGVITVCRPDGLPLSVENTFSGLWHIDKPMQQSALNELVLKAFAYVGTHATEKIEIRSRVNTYYEKPDDIIYAKKRGFANYIYLTANRRIRYYGEFEDLHNNILTDARFVVFTKDMIINKTHVTECSKHHVRLDNGMKFRIPLFHKNPILEALP